MIYPFFINPKVTQNLFPTVFPTYFAYYEVKLGKSREKATLEMLIYQGVLVRQEK